MVACVSVGPRGRASPKSATLAVTGSTPASIHTLMRSGCGCGPPEAGGLHTDVVDCSSTLPALRSPCLQVEGILQQSTAWHDMVGDCMVDCSGFSSKLQQHVAVSEGFLFRPATWLDSQGSETSHCPDTQQQN
jgi:hypothetical protein